MSRARRAVIKDWPRSRKRLQNAYGKWISESESDLKILAHLLQGVEAKMLEAVRKCYPNEILLLQHDGFASSVPLDMGKMTEAIFEASGYVMQIEESRIQLDTDLGVAYR